MANVRGVWSLVLGLIVACSSSDNGASNPDAAPADAVVSVDSGTSKDSGAMDAARDVGIAGDSGAADDSGTSDAELDAAVDGGRDAMLDGGPMADGGPDAATDAGHDAGPLGSTDGGLTDAGMARDGGIVGCSRGTCPIGQVCHGNGRCGVQCANNADCSTIVGAGFYCNTAGQPAPNYFKPYRDRNSCAPLGCERQVECGFGRVCDPSTSPPSCVDGCFTDLDCLSGQVCKDGPQGSYTVQQCRALPNNPPNRAGVCCNPGCVSRILQCPPNQFCCGETGSPFQNTTSCGPVTAGGSQQASGGQCFEMPVSPWCVQCTSDAACNSGWTFGFNVDPAINGGMPFQEQEWCTSVSATASVCSVTCNPNAADDGCPRGWLCQPFFPTCSNNADCGGLACVGGRCRCGQNGIPSATCPSTYGTLTTTVAHPRCVDRGVADLFCAASYNCVPPPAVTGYPMACGL